MSKNSKLIAATRRVQGEQKMANQTAYKWGRRTNGQFFTTRNTDDEFAAFWAVLSWPFRILWRGLCGLWNWIRNIDMVGLVNVALLIAIIVLFSVLIMDIIKCTRCTITEHRDSSAQITVTDGKYLGSPGGVPEPITLPLKKNLKPKWKTVEPITVTKRGETTIDPSSQSDATAAPLTENTIIEGNLILQNMHRYTLPCGTEVHGNIIMRDVGLVRFCGAIRVTGDIYVSSRTSFGPIPRDSKIGGQVIF